MRATRKHLLWGVPAISACIVLALVLSTRRGPRSDELAHFEALEGFRVVSRIEKRYSTHYRLEGRDLVLRLEAISGADRAAADMLAEQGRQGILALYGDALSPYPGDISRKIVPDKKYQPTYVKRSEGDGTYTYFFLFANSRLGYGAVIAENVEFRSLLGWFHTERFDTFYKVRIYAPLERPSRDLQRLFLALESA